MENNIDFKKISLEKIYTILNTDQRGLDELEAMKRLKTYGFNDISHKKKISAIVKFLSYFKNPLVLILFVAAIASGMTGEYKNFIIINLMVILSVLLNFYQEHKSNKAAEKIVSKLAVKTLAIRDNEKKEIVVKYVVPGDVLVLSAGDIVPADGRIIESDDFFVNESALTGESFPVEKTVERVNSDYDQCVFSGTNVVSGSATVIITQTGKNTEFGKIADKLIVPDEVNAFELGINNFGFLIIKAVVFIVLLIFFINISLKKDLIDTFIFSIAVAVGLTPELLPMIMSVNMSKGSIAMAKKGVIVKRLNAIPDFGSMDILCTDKTGTLTEDNITVVKHLDVFGANSNNVLRYAYINSLFETGLKSLMDKAILDFKHISIDNLKKIDEIPYDFDRKRLSVIYEENNNRLMTTKGAPEELFRISTTYIENGEIKSITPADLTKFKNTYDDLGKQGFRVLAVATKDVADGLTVYPKTEESEMCLQGFIAFYDPPKQSAKETLEFMHQHGIEVKVITGDSPLVAKKICEDLNFKITNIMVGDEEDIDKMTDDALGVKAVEANIFARFSPHQKERIISVLRKRGNVVGYLGDGINDAPSLKSADVGISVHNAVDVAKETADIILMQKGLKELMDGVIEGRKTFGNTIKYILMGLSSNFGNMFSMVGAALYLPFFPMLPGQILLNNFMYDTSQVSIPSDKVDEEYLKKPKHWNIKFIRNFMLIFGPISTIFDFLTFYVLYGIFHTPEAQFQTGWFIESLATQILVVFIIRTRKIPFLQSSPSKYLFGAVISVVGLGILIATTNLGRFFGFSPLPLNILCVIFGMVIIYLVLVEIVKQLFYKKLSGISNDSL